MVDHNAGTQRHFKSHMDFTCHKCINWVNWIQEQYIGNMNSFVSNPAIHGEFSKVAEEMRKYVEPIGIFK